jgi:hypothetical protein
MILRRYSKRQAHTPFTSDKGADMVNAKLAQLRARLSGATGIRFIVAADSVIRGTATPTAENAGRKGRDICIAR